MSGGAAVSADAASLHLLLRVIRGLRVSALDRPAVRAHPGALRRIALDRVQPPILAGSAENAFEAEGGGHTEEIGRSGSEVEARDGQPQ